MTEQQERVHAHELLDRVPAGQVPAAVRFLEFLIWDPVARAAALAPLDDEPLTEEDSQRLSGSSSGVPMEEVLAEYGLKLEDFPQRP
jgi:hypothetical protein